MVQYPDDYLFRRQLIATLRPSWEKEVLCRGITVEFSSMQDILEKAKDIEDSLHYDIRSRMSSDMMHSNAYINHSMVKSSKWMIGAALRDTAGQTMANRQVPKPIRNMSSNTCKIPEISGKQPSKEGELKCYKCGQKGVLELLIPKPKFTPRSISMPRSQPMSSYLLYSSLVFCCSQAPISIATKRLAQP